MALPARRRGSAAEWSPGTELESFYDRMNRLFGAPMGLIPEMRRTFEDIESWSPPADISETNENYLVELELPGVRKENVDIQLTERELRISAETSAEERREEERRTHLSSRRYGRWEYRTVLPGEVNSEEVTAHLENGVLTVTVPKAQSSEPRRIEVQ